MEAEGFRALFVNVAGHSFAVEVGQVEALRRKETLYPARDGPPDLQGYLRLGEQVVPVLDLGVRLGLRDAGRRTMGVLMVTSQDLPALAFQVDQIEGTDAVPWSEAALLPELLRTLQRRPIVWGLIWQEDGLVPLLDLGQIVPPEEVAMLQKAAQEYKGGHDAGSVVD